MVSAIVTESRAISAPVAPSRDTRAMALWLFSMCALVALMVTVGGATRLTDSGLSITEWKPVTGAIPPLSAEAWGVEFEKYKRIPEYELVNRGMSLEEFKVIYWWEWGHRFLGRLIGLAFVIPLIFFVLRGAVDRALGGRLFALLLLGGAQGALGWYMVQSGLTERVDVSQYRLAAHLGLAIFLFAALLWTALDLRARAAPTVEAAPAKAFSPGVFWGAIALCVAVYGQIILGAFVAGLRAGRTYTTWPLMDGRFFPAAYFETGGALAFFESVAAVQFNHRIGAYLLAFAGLWFVAAVQKTAIAKPARWFAVALAAQILIGIATLVSATPLSLGLIHQAGALAVFTTILFTAHQALMVQRSASAPAAVSS